MSNKSEGVPEVTLDDFDKWLKEYVGTKGKLAVLLDYDGTLSPIVAHPDLAVIPLEAKEVLQKLAKMPDVFVAIVSGRNVDNVKGLVGIDGISYAGNHGLEILLPNGTRFNHPMPADYTEKVAGLLKALEAGPCHDGAWVENKGTVLTFHYRETPEELREPMIAQAETLMKENGFKIGKGHCVLEARPPVQWNKGKASHYILNTSFGEDWAKKVKIIFAGDDVTDEDAMQALKGSAISFRVTTTRNVITAANHLLPNTDSVHLLLKWILQHVTGRTSS